MEKLSVGLKIGPDELSQCVELHQNITETLNKKGTVQLSTETATFLRDFLNEIISSSVTKAYKLENIGNNFLDCYYRIKK